MHFVFILDAISMGHKWVRRSKIFSRLNLDDGLMGSSAKTGKKIFRGSQEHFLHKSAIWDRTPPHLHIKCSLHVCGRVQGSQIFKQNSIILMHSKVIAFLVISLSPWSMWSPSSPHHLCHPHIISIAPRRSPCGPHGCGLHGLHPMLSPWSPWSPRHPHGPHIVPVIPTSSPHCLKGPHIISNPPDTHSTHPHPPRGWGPKSVKMQ